jgi:hypothetical protein
MTAAAATLVAALHVSDRIKDYGSYAGFACVLGLAVLSLLYFAQAREVKRLREWAGRAPERDAELQARVTAEAQQRAAATAAPAAPAAAAPKPATAAATPAGQAKPAAAPAQQPQPQPAQTPASAPKPGVPAPATAAAAAAGAAASASASPATAKPEAPKTGDGATPQPSTPTPPTPSGTNGAVDQPTQITPAPAPAAAVTSTPTPTPKPGQPLRPPTPAPAVDDDHGKSPLRMTLMIVGGVLAVAVVVLVLVLTVFNGSDNTKSPNTIGNAPVTTGATSTSNGKSNATKTAPLSRGDVTVAVLNGTTIPGLARSAGTKLQNAGFKLGTVTNAPDQARSATVVSYQPGHINEARVVARLIHVGTDAVKPIDQSTQVVAGQDATVVVTVGADQSQ